jgi:hypothetical protein
MRTIFCALLILICLGSTAQKPIFRFSFEGIGDNREFHNGKSKSQTILGTLGSCEVGTKIDQNSLFAGISELYEFGSPINFHRPRLIMYYKYEVPKIEFQFGSFPRLGTIDFPLAMLADTLAYYRPQIEGMSGKLSGNWGHQLAFVDWTGRQTKTVRESFMVGTSGEIKLGKWFLQNYILMNHLAHPADMVEIVHIKDHFGFSFMTGVNLGSEKLIYGNMKGGILTSLYRERSVTDGFQTHHSFYFEGSARYRDFSLKTTLHCGEKLQFAMGDPLYRFSNYLRTDMIWYFINLKKVQARFNWSLHWIDWNQLDHSQQLSLIFRL